MCTSFARISVFALLVVAVGNVGRAGEPDRLAGWRNDVTIRPVSTVSGRHTIHAYFNVTPESPDGRSVLFFASTTADSHQGKLCVVDRASGTERTVADDIATEDAHRAACQQWVAGGRYVVFHRVRANQWQVVAVEMATGKEKVLANDRQLGWSQPGATVVPVYGCHWNPAGHRDLELIDVETGATKTALSVAAVEKQYASWIAQKLPGKEVSIFFPVLSPDLTRVFFKLAAPAGGDFRSSRASTRLGFFCYDLNKQAPVFQRDAWGHPAWHPDSHTVIEAGNELIDTSTGKARRMPGLPPLSGAPHPSLNFDGTLFVTDPTLAALGGKKTDRGIVVGPTTGGDYVIVDRFDNSHGARSWRPSHPHPVFSADGQRIYYNVNRSTWTELFVAECASARPSKQ